MQNFDYRTYEREGFPYRFPKEFLGGDDLWEGFVENPSYESFNQLRNKGTELKSKKTFSCPRVFISHRQCDTQFAERIAWLANQNDFYYWLDVHDPSLKNLHHISINPYQKSLITGAIIEMAILNCTHVLAVFTPQTQGSMWVPYEYGRIVDLPQNSSRASCWLHRDIGYVPEYLNFGRTHFNEGQIENWFLSERRSYLDHYQLNGGRCNPEWDGQKVPESLD